MERTPGAAKRIVLIGLDAADLDVIGPLMAAGRMPVIADLIARGTSGVLHSTIPPVSAPAWATFLTGVEPGRHGLYAFVVERPGGGTSLARSSDIRAPKLWHHCAAQGLRAVVANVPVTYPPEACDGAVVVTGMLTPESPDVVFTHPPALSAEIRAAIPGYRIDVDKAMMSERATLFDRMDAITRGHRDLFRHLLRTQPFDVFAGIFTNTDRAQHCFWRSDRALVDRMFEDADRYVGEVLSAADLSETVVMLMSDHGFGGARWKLYVNRALEDAGLLATTRSAAPDPHMAKRRADSFEDFQGGGGAHRQDGVLGKVLAAVGVGGEAVVDWPRTKAFLWSLDTGGVAVNLKSRYPHGTVADADYERVRDEVIAALRALRTGDGRPVYRTVRRREEAYAGEHAASAPDVVVEPQDDVAFGMDLDAKDAVREHKRPEGTHSPRGFFSITGPGIRAGLRTEAKIADCLPTMLHAIGAAVPAVTDGRVIAEAFVESRPVRTLAPGAASAAADPRAAYTAEEEAELRKALEGLGYL
ncbi:MAG: hypothetical protein HMLKMBBP_03908 [Planctomycetes bacterium]|nr:hypothetical protein [Planctomycetota bacterium]